MDMPLDKNPTIPSPVDNGGADASSLPGHVCPFCGMVRKQHDVPCFHCTMPDTPATRQATLARLGPWFVLQKRNTSAPGMNFATLVALVERGQVTGKSIVRGPTTNQLWTYAAYVKGLSRLVGCCYSCGAVITPSTNMCPVCGKLQEPPLNPDVLLEIRPVKRPAIKDFIPATELPTEAPPEPEPVPEPAPELEQEPMAPAKPLAASELARAFHVDPPPAPAQARPKGWRRFFL